jgi:hypothetical protein
MIGRELRSGRYVVTARLGGGAQGDTWEARDRARADRAVAVKAFRVGTARAWKDVELAEREARTLALLEHDLLPRYIEHFEEEGTLYLVMERIEGESVAELRRRRVRFDANEVLRMLRDFGRALGYLHSRTPPVVHRDVKPGNVVQRRDGRFALVDFGAVRDRMRPEGGSTVVGTFGYMAPEQFQGRASPASDVYGAGATALAMLTGREPEDLPHEGLAIDVARAMPAGTPKELVRALERMLAADPDKRARSIEDAFAGAQGRTPTTHTERRQAHARHRAERRARKRERRAARRSHGARVPFLPRLLVHLALWIASLVVWVTVGLVTPLLLAIFSLFFGSALRRAASACMRAALATQRALGNASGWVAGKEREEGALPSGEEVHSRVAEEPERLRVASEEEEEEEDARAQGGARR